MIIDKIKKIVNFKILYILLIVAFAIPSIIHIIRYGFVLKGMEYFYIFINNANHNMSVTLSGLIYLMFFVLMFGLYFLIIKNRNKIFKNIKNILCFILIVSVLFAVILPISSSDVYSYATTGEIQSKYGANPYYDTVGSVKQANDTANNEILSSINIWDNQLVIYGPLWSLICSIVTLFSFSKISVALILFKFLAIAIHIANCILMYKISHRKIWVLFYGLNPYILFETISNVHNDLYIVFFTLLGIYFLVKKKNIAITLMFMACATCVKYITVLLVPIILIYYYRKENVGKRVLKCIRSGLLFTFFVIMLYLIYLRNIEMIFYVLIQQSKYRESIWAAIGILSNEYGWVNVKVAIILKIVSIFLLTVYVIFILKLLFMKNIKFKKIMNNWNNILVIFILGYISNLCVWYFVWLFATVMWQNTKNTRIVMYLPFIYEMLVSRYFFLGVEWAMKSYAFSTIAILFVILITNIDKIKLLKNMNKKLIS